MAFGLGLYSFFSWRTIILYFLPASEFMEAVALGTIFSVRIGSSMNHRVPMTYACLPSIISLPSLLPVEKKPQTTSLYTQVSFLPLIILLYYA